MFARNIVKTTIGVGLATWVACVAGCKTDALHRGRSREGLVVESPRDPPRIKASRESLDVHPASQQEVDFVEEVLVHRAKYHRSLEQLRSFYESRGYDTKRGWAQFELDGIKSVKAFRYLVDAEVPSETLRPSEPIEEANALYEKGLELMQKGGHGVPALYRQDLMIQAAGAFKDLVERYPTSDKIDDAAFMCGEIHKEYLPDQEIIAVKWYERAWTWNPDTPHPARFQAAVVYDYRLHDRDRALELYQQVVEREIAIQSNVRFAMRRVGELTESKATRKADTKITRVENK